MYSPPERVVAVPGRPLVGLSEMVGTSGSTVKPEEAKIVLPEKTMT